jgi:hypothetical protein
VLAGLEIEDDLAALRAYLRGNMLDKYGLAANLKGLANKPLFRFVRSANMAVQCVHVRFLPPANAGGYKYIAPNGANPNFPARFRAFLSFFAGVPARRYTAVNSGTCSSS